MMIDEERAIRALTDVVAVDELAPGFVRVTSWSDSYLVDARGEGCECADKQYNLPPGGLCKHHAAAFLATSEYPSPYLETHDTGDELIADGGAVEGQRKGNRPEGHDQWTLWDPDHENAKFFESRPEVEEAEERALDAPGIERVEIYGPGESPEAMYHGESPETDERETESNAVLDDDGPAKVKCAECGETLPAADATNNSNYQPVHPDCVADESAAREPSDAPDANHEPEVMSPEEVEAAAEELPERNVGTDPIKWLPGEFVDMIDGSPAINRKGFEVLGHFYDVDIDSEMVTPPEETNHEYCRVKAVARIDDRTVEAWGTAHVDRGDDHYLLAEMADTRARKRALSIATGAGAIAVEELQNEVDR